VSLPTARQRPDDTAPSQRSGKALVSGAVPAAMGDPMIGRVLDGRFTIESRLGAGSMGTVYRAKQHAMGRDVAIKILRSDRALDDAARARFLREARANSLLASPHTVTVFDFGQADNGDFFLAMEMLEGESVGQRIQRMKRVPVDQAVDTARQALRSLAEAHAKGIIHRDLKPDNLFYAKVLTAAGQHEEIVKVLDFGIAKMLTDDAGAMNAVETQAGTVFGTPRYMSPEQAQGKPLDARSDLYSLGVILYHMLTGRPPFTDDDAIVVMARHIKTAPKPPIEACPQAHIPPEIEAVLLRVLSKEAAQRPLTAEAMSQELARAMSLSATATSGVRASLSGATLPPPSTSKANGVMAATAAPVSHVPSAPLSGQDVSAFAAGPGLDTSELAAAAGIPSKRRKRAVVLGSVVALVILGAVLVGVRAHLAADAPGGSDVAATAPKPRAPAPPGVTNTNALAPVAPNGASIPSIPSIPAAASPPAPPPNATAKPAANSPPLTNFNDLPRASSKPASPVSRPAARPSPAAPKPSPPPATTSSGHYGLFE
jgi:serine/threonine protein kinase